MPVKLRHIMKYTLAGACAALFIFSGHTAFAGSVQHACLSAGSSKANYRVCRCIQSAADATLNVKDQSLAASIIRNLVNWRGPFVLRMIDAMRCYSSAAK